jgi:hypothetical protein
MGTGFWWRKLQLVGFGPCKAETPQAEQAAEKLKALSF